MTANVGSTVITDPVQVTTTLRSAEPGRSGYLVTATVGGRPPVAGQFEATSIDAGRALRTSTDGRGRSSGRGCRCRRRDRDAAV